MQLSHFGRAGLLAGALVGGALLLGACGSSSTTPPTSTTGGGGATTTTAGGGATTTTAGGGATTTTAGGTSSNPFSSLASKLQSGQSIAFDATYKITGAATLGTLELAAEPPSSSAFISTNSSGSGGDIISTASTGYVCSKPTSGAVTCLNYPPAQLSTFEAAFTVFTGKYWVQEATSLQAAAAGIHASSSSMSLAGQSLNCVTWSGGTGPVTSGEVCVTSQGVLGYAKAGPTTLALTSYSTSPPASLFSPPAGATITTVP